MRGLPGLLVALGVQVAVDPEGNLRLQRKVAVATVVPGGGWDRVGELAQALCLFTRAHNAEQRHDIVVFSEQPLGPEQTQALQQAAAPAALSTQVLYSTPQHFLERMGLDEPTAAKACGGAKGGLTWASQCCDTTKADPTCSSLGYDAAAFFRARELWTHPALAAYDYLYWLDSDTFSTQAWPKDPVELLEEHDLVLLFDNFPVDKRGALFRGVEAAIQSHFGQPLCGVALEAGALVPGKCGGPAPERLDAIWGNFFVARLGFFRGDQYQSWAKAFVGNGASILRKRWDDETAMTVGVAKLAPGRAAQLSHYADLGLYHEGFLDARATAGSGSGGRAPFREYLAAAPSELAAACRVSYDGLKAR